MQFCEARGLSLSEPSDEQYLEISSHLTGEVRGVLTVAGSLASRAGVSGTAPARVAEQRDHLHERLAAVSDSLGLASR